MHPSRRSLPFPLNCQLVSVGTADYGGASDQVSQTRGSEQVPLVVFVLVMKAGSLQRSDCPEVFPRPPNVSLPSVHFETFCRAGLLHIGRAEGLLPTWQGIFGEWADRAKAVHLLLLPRTGRYFCIWTLGPEGF